MLRSVLAVLLLLPLGLLATALAAQQPAGGAPADTVPAAQQPVGDPGGVDTVPVAPQPAIPTPGDTIPVASPPTGDPVAGDPTVGDSIPLAQPDTPLVDAAADTLPEGVEEEPQRPPLSPAADSVVQALRSLEGFIATEYHGDNAEYRAEDGALRLEGKAEVTRIGDRLTADTIVFREREDLVAAYGGARAEGQGQQPVDSDSLFYELTRRRATALGARTEIVETTTWYVEGDVTLEGTDRLWGSHAQFTSCDLEIPHYHFEADEVFVFRNRILVARPARLYFGDVPVMILPFIVQNLQEGRRSGLLTPRFGLSDIVRSSRGYTREISDVGFYWAMNEYMGSQVSLTWRSGAYTALLGGLDFNWRRQFLSGRMDVQRFWQQDGPRELSLNGNTSWQPDERTNLGMTMRYASSSRFVEDATYDPREATQDLNSGLSVGRRFDWGRVSMGADRRQSIATGDVSMTLPSFSISPNALTLFRSTVPDQQRWYSNATFNPGVVSGSRFSSDFSDNIASGRQDQTVTKLRAGPSFSIGNLSLSAGGELNRSDFLEAAGLSSEQIPITLDPFRQEDASWSASASYRQPLIGTTNISPRVSLSQELRRDTLTADGWLGGPRRVSFGAGLNTDLYGFFPGFAGFTAIRHRFSPRFSYSYAPEVKQTALQESVFGRAGGRTQNRVSLSFNQTWEAKLREPRPREEPPAVIDSITGDTIPPFDAMSAPPDEEKVTLLSITTSALEYDFVKAREEGSGFVTQRVNNTINSDYLRGLTIQMQHELFDRSDLDPNDPETVGELGRFGPRLASLSTSFQLGPQTALIRWLDRLAGGEDESEEPEPGDVLAGEPPDDDPSPPGQGAATGNPQATGHGPWRVGLSYQFSRPPRVFRSGEPVASDAVQTVDADMAFQLTPNWSVTWGTSYSITDHDFGAHRLNFARDMHEWQANFSFYQTPNGNTAFEFSVELIHNRDLRFDHAERNLGIDRR